MNILKSLFFCAKHRPGAGIFDDNDSEDSYESIYCRSDCSHCLEIERKENASQLINKLQIHDNDNEDEEKKTLARPTLMSLAVEERNPLNQRDINITSAHGSKQHAE